MWSLLSRAWHAVGFLSGFGVLLSTTAFAVGALISFVLAPLLLVNNGAGLQKLLQNIAEVKHPGEQFSPADYLILLAVPMVVIPIIGSVFLILMKRIYFGKPPKTGIGTFGFVLMVMTTYFVLIHSFACAYLGLVALDPNSLFIDGKSSDAGFDIVTAYYFSLTTIATVGYGDIRPGTSFAKIVAMVEILTGLGYTVFIFAVVASFIRGRSD